MTEITLELSKSLIPVRTDEGHKGTFGTCLVVAGSPDMTGALTLCTEAALRSGVGITRVLSHKEALLPTKIKCPCAVFSSYKDSFEETKKELDKIMPRISAVAIGPGLDYQDKMNYQLLDYFISNAKSLVIDASALTILAKYKEELLPKLSERTEKGLNPAILTPHIGEYKRLNPSFGEDIFSDSVQFALQNKCVVALKNNKTIVSDEAGRCYINKVGNSGMAKGGSGDVLTGLIAGFCAQGMSAINATVLSVYLHSRSGIIASEELGKRYMLPTDVLVYLADAMDETGDGEKYE